MAFRRDALGNDLRFDPRLGPSHGRATTSEETLLIDGLRARGAEVVWVPAMRLRHYVAPERMTLPYLMRFYRDFARGEARRKGPPAGARVLGVPQWVLRQVAEARLRNYWHRVRGHRQAALVALRQYQVLFGHGPRVLHPAPGEVGDDDRRMKVAILVWSRIWGGLESHVMDLAATALEDGHQVIVACVGADTAALFQARGMRAPIQVINPPAAGVGILAWYRQFRALGVQACIYEKGTLHAGSLSLDVAARAAFRVFVAIQQLEPPVLGARRTKRHMGGLVPGLGLWWYRQRFRGWLRSLAPVRTICITEAVRSALATAYGFSPQRLPVIYNGVDTDRFSPATDETAPDETPGVVGSFTFGTSARLEREKGIDVAIHAFAQVVRDAPGVPMRLLVANHGSERAGARAARESAWHRRPCPFSRLPARPPRVLPNGRHLSGAEPNRSTGTHRAGSDGKRVPGDCLGSWRHPGNDHSE